MARHNKICKRCAGLTTIEISPSIEGRRWVDVPAGCEEAVLLAPDLDHASIKMKCRLP